MAEDQQPTLHLLSGKRALDLDSLMALYTKLTGKEPTPEAREGVRLKLEAAQAKR